MKLQVSSSPHIREQSSTRRIMLDVVISLIPALLASVFFFGLRALAVVAVTVGSCILTEYLCRKVMKRDNTIVDLSAVVTGLLLAYSLPPAIPLWICVIGAVVAIGVVKQMFGGIGNNFVNPAIAARIILMISFPLPLSTWTMPAGPADLVTAATPLESLNRGFSYIPTYWEMFLGFKGGCLGEISIIALLLGAGFLLYRKVIKVWIPFSYIATVLLIVAIAGRDPLFHLLSGGLVLGAFFMATDYVTSPLTTRGKLIYGIGCGLITALIRLFGGMAEGVSYAILLMNILTPHIDRITLPVPFGGGEKRAG
jgi:electron transport complex protein RnfD